MFDPKRHNRHSIRLRGYNYSRAGAYFITLCAEDMRHRFGVAAKGRVVLNDAGKMVERWTAELPRKFPAVRVDESVVMPNHFHAIFVFGDVRADTQGADTQGADTQVRADTQGADTQVRPYLGTVVQWLKTMSTNEYIRGVKMHGWPRFDGTLWQRNYYERIVRDDAALTNIRRYIRENPANFTALTAVGEPRVVAGNPEILSLPRMGFMASRGRGGPMCPPSMCPPSTIGGGHIGPPLRLPLPRGWAVMSTFLSPMEQRLFRALRERGIPAVRVLPWGGTDGRMCPPNLCEISPFPDTLEAPSARRAMWCNEYIMNHCQKLTLGPVSEGGMLECLLSDTPPGLELLHL
jgi:REP element-mobilizing transposase RayT